MAHIKDKYTFLSLFSGKKFLLTIAFTPPPLNIIIIEINIVFKKERVMNKYLKALSLLGMLSISSFSLALKWGFTNITDKILVVEVKKAKGPFFNIVGPGQRTDFFWLDANCLADILIGEYNEQKAKNFPGTNSPKLPKESGKNALDAKKITSAIDARGDWFNSLDQMQKNSPALFVIAQDKWDNLNSKFTAAAAKLITGTSSQEVTTSLNFNIPNEIKSNLTLGDVPSGSPLVNFTNTVKCNGREFFIVDNEGKFALVAKR